MSTKTNVYIGTIIGSILGGLIPTLWGAGEFTFSSILFSGIGAIAGIVIAFKLSNW